MNKNPWKSKTVWGGALLAVEAALLASGLETYTWFQPVVTLLGTFLTVFGFRDAIK